ncbi:MAG: DUF3145 family protein [Actinomycetes bacterium]|jgi:Protein of unknown function (DUF3145)
MSLSGDLQIHSAPRALLRHIQWSLNSIFEETIPLDWITQPLAAGTYSCEVQWRSSSNKERASKIASTLKSWHFIRFEVREFPTEGGEGVLYRATPDLGMHQAVTCSTGDIMIHENRILAILGQSHGYETLRENLQSALGIQWDSELERYRQGIEFENPPLRISI